MPRDRYDDDDDDDRPRRSRRRRRDDDDDFDRPPKKGGMSGGVIALIVVGICVAVLAVCGGVVYVVAMPAIARVRDAGSRMEAQNNLKQTGLAQHNFESSTQSFSRPFLDTDQQGNQITPPADPANRLSWRVALLPFLGDGEGASAYSRFNIREGWNSPANLSMKDVPIRAYRHPLDAQEKGEPVSRTRCFYDNGALFESKPHSRIGFLGVTDGLSNTLMYVESTETVTWTAFNDFRYEPNAPLPAFGHPKTSASGFQVAYADGSVRFVRSSASPQAIKGAITRAGGEVGFLD
jgi:hypothetical protein